MKPGNTVQRGDVIGYVGSTGRATGDHLHYEVLANGQTLNPLRFSRAIHARPLTRRALGSQPPAVLTRPLGLRYNRWIIPVH